MPDPIGRRNAVRRVMARNEIGGAHVADGQARATGSLGVLFSSTGPGAANAVPGPAEAGFAGGPARHPDAATRVGYLVIAIIFAVSTLNYADRAALSIAGSAMQHEIGFSPVTFGYAFSSFGWACVLAQLPSGWLPDRFGSKRVTRGRSSRGRRPPSSRRSSTRWARLRRSPPCSRCASPRAWPGRPRSPATAGSWPPGSTALHMNIMRAGFVAAVPAICGFAGGVLGGMISDGLLRRGWSLAAARETPVVLGMLLAASLAARPLAGSNGAVVVLMSLAFFGRGIGALGWAVGSDTTPQAAAGLGSGCSTRSRTSPASPRRSSSATSCSGRAPSTGRSSSSR